MTTTLNQQVTTGQGPLLAPEEFQSQLIAGMTQALAAS